MHKPKRRSSAGDPSNHIGFLDEAGTSKRDKDARKTKRGDDLDLDRLWER